MGLSARVTYVWSPVSTLADITVRGDVVMGVGAESGAEAGVEVSGQNSRACRGWNTWDKFWRISVINRSRSLHVFSSHSVNFV